MTTVLDLPAEVKYHIATYLGSTDAQSLAITCRAFQDPAEQVIWSSVLIDQLLYDTGHAEGDDVVLSEEDRMRIYTQAAEQLVFRANRVLTALTNRPPRSAIRALICHLCLENHIALREIVHRSLHTLQGFHIESLAEYVWPYDWDRRTEDPSRVSEFYDMIIRDNLRFPRLDDLSFSISLDWQKHFGELTSLMPRLRQIRIIQLLDTWSFEPVDPELPPWPTLSNVHTVEIDCTYNFLRPATAILRHLSHAKTIVIEGKDLQLDDEGDEPFISALREHKAVETFTWCLEDYLSRFGIDRLFDGTGWDNLKTLCMGAGVEMESETYLENFGIPPAKSLEQIIIPCRNTAWYPKNKAPDWGKAAPPRGSLATSTVHQLRNAPALKVVYFASDTQPDEDPNQWCCDKINGVLIRSYTNGEDEMFHLRRLELLKINPKLYDPDEDYQEGVCEGEGKDHQWMSQTFFEGYRVPDDVLAKVYKLRGETLDWVEPGRGLTLPDKAWDVLKKGRKKAMKTRDW